MEILTEFIQQHALYAHWIIFGALLLAGLNIPVSEDLMLFLSALLANQYPENLYKLFFAVYMGAFFSDLICFALGRYLGKKIWKSPFWSRFISKEKVESVQGFYAKWGILTLILGRFIPFGVRNALFLSAGIGKMHAGKFALSDFIACTISCSLYFYLYYKFGPMALEFVKQSNVYLFSVFLIIIGTIGARKYYQRRF